MAERSQNLQDLFLNSVRKSKNPLTIFLINGVKLTGVVTKIDWRNPHTHLYVDVKDDTGKVVNWTLEGYPPNVLARTGWTKDVTVKVGDIVSIFGWRARDGSPAAHLREATLADGKHLFFGPPAGTGEGAAVAGK